VNIYNREETHIGNFYKINYLLARQLLSIYDILKCRIQDATANEISQTIIETAYHFDNKVSYGYDYVPKGWMYYLLQEERHYKPSDFINWFFKNKQQPRDYLIDGVMKHKSEKRQPIKKDADNTNMNTAYATTEYGDIPLEIDDGAGYKPSAFIKRF